VRERRSNSRYFGKCNIIVYYYSDVVVLSRCCQNDEPLSVGDTVLDVLSCVSHRLASQRKEEYPLKGSK
jgi:hypothetical protein